MDFDNKKFMVEWDYLYEYVSEDGYNDSSQLRTTGEKFETEQEAKMFIVSKFNEKIRNIKLYNLSELELSIKELEKLKVLNTLKGGNKNDKEV